MALMSRMTTSSTTMAAAVSALNSAAAAGVAQLKMMVGSAVYGPGQAFHDASRSRRCRSRPPRRPPAAAARSRRTPGRASG